MAPPGFMKLALAAAQAAAEAGEVPVGAVLVDPADNTVIATAGAERLGGLDLYVTLEPCAMCAGAISLARLRRVYYAAPDPKGGAVDHGPRFFAQGTCHHQPEVYAGIDEVSAAELLRGFFRARR